jgi:hypothetical protein
MAWNNYRRPYYNRQAVGPSGPQYAAAPADPADMVRIDAVLSDAGFSTLINVAMQDFVKSIKIQAASKKLSDAQVKYLASVEEKLVPADSSWWDATNPENIAKRAFTAAYYKANGYYHVVVNAMENDAAHMPNSAVWEKMWDNKYINIAWSRFTAGARFAIAEVAQGKYSFGPVKTGIVQSVVWNHVARQWCYSFISFESPQPVMIKENEMKKIKAPKVVKVAKAPKAPKAPKAEKPAPKPRKKKEA